MPEISTAAPAVPAFSTMLLALIVFCVGAMGVLLRRNAIIVFASIEVMMNAANLAFITFADAWGGTEGRIFVFFVIVVAAAEAAIGLGIVIAMDRLHGTVDVDRASIMRG